MRNIDAKGRLPNFKGAAIGNGVCHGCEYSSDAQKAAVFGGHAMIPLSLQADIAAECGDFSKESEKCSELIGSIRDFTGDYNTYNIYDTCGSDTAAGADHARALLRSGVADVRGARDAFTVQPAYKQARAARALGGALNDYTCGGETAMDAWLANDRVRRALHVDDAKSGGSYHSDATDHFELYQNLTKKYRMIIYSGDVDDCVPYWGSQTWTANLGYEVAEPWHPWYSDSLAHKGEVVAGYAIKYRVPDAEHDFQFVTVKGAGHMVPTYKPVFALTFLTKFLKGEDF